jgi:hypothetical protein
MWSVNPRLGFLTHLASREAVGPTLPTDSLPLRDTRIAPRHTHTHTYTHTHTHTNTCAREVGVRNWARCAAGVTREASQPTARNTACLFAFFFFFQRKFSKFSHLDVSGTIPASSVSEKVCPIPASSKNKQTNNRPWG